MATERKEKLIRVLQIMESTDEKSPMNASQIVEKLDSKYTLGDIDRRSIYRDISMLQYCGYQITQCKDKRKGWYMEKHAFDDWEIKIMMDAVQQAKCVSDKEAVEIREKLLALTSNRGRSRFSHMMRPIKDCSDVVVEIGKYIEMMLEAMFLHKKIEFQYTEITNDMEKVLRRNGKIYKLNLYTIYWASNNYYLVGSHDNHDGLTHYRLDRILNLSISDEYAIDAKEKVGVNPESYIQKYIEESVNHFSGDLVRIEVQYTPDPVTNAILYDFAGRDIKVYKQKDGTYRALFMKMNTVTLAGWFLQYVNRFEVIAPADLRTAISKEIHDAMQKYEG
ncbi:MAG TPA: WYL domain-containing protein [Candidatus Merdenecus merdavium]|nr:WYL domain-containing protein [Candidatus Merdenecus merdavium]